MPPARQSDIFKLNFFFWSLFGIWPFKRLHKFYKYYSLIYLFITLLLYNILLTLNLFYTPLKIELVIREVIFYFTEVAVTSKVLTILLKRDQLIDIFDLLDCEEFIADDEVSKKIIKASNASFKTYWRLYAIVSNVAYSSQVFLSLVFHLIWKVDLELPICKYYFLSDNVRESFFVYLFIYQSVGIYGHMMYNVNVDTFIAGVMWMAITQIRVLNSKFCRLKLDSKLSKLRPEFQDRIQIAKLNRILRHYDLVLKYCGQIQSIISVTMFVQFTMASAIVCVVLCGFVLLSSSTDFMIFMFTYLIAMTSQIFVPTWLGTQLEYESQALMFAAYKCEWIPRSEAFKRGIRIFVERAKRPIQLTGLKLFTLSLATFTSIMKTAYSLFTLIRNVEDQISTVQ